MDRPDVHYVITDDDVRIAHQDFGSGPPTVLSGAILSHLEASWEFDPVRRVFERMAANLRVLLFDHRGSGMSDGYLEAPSLNDRALDIKAVMDAAEVERANLIGIWAGGIVGLGFAAAYPHRVDRLVLANSELGPSAKARADELYPAGAELELDPLTAEDLDTIGTLRQDTSVADHSPSVAKFADFGEQLLKHDRLVGTRHAAKRQLESFAAIDAVPIAPRVKAPTLVAHTVGNRRVHLGYARLLAELIPAATLVEFEGDDHAFWAADNWRDIFDAQIRFITGTEVDAPAERRFAVVLFTDIVESTSVSLASGDDEWRRRLDTHDRIAHQVITGHGGSLVKHTGDGLLATFDTPSRAIDATLQFRDELEACGIRIRAGLHGGEIELRGDDISGAVVNLAARVEQVAADGDIYTTKTIRDMLIGTPHHFNEAGTHTLKGFDGEWRLYQTVAN